MLTSRRTAIPRSSRQNTQWSLSIALVFIQRRPNGQDSQPDGNEIVGNIELIKSGRYPGANGRSSIRDSGRSGDALHHPDDE